MDGLTAILADTASALSTQRLDSEMTIRLLDKALDQQGQMAMSLLQSLPAASPAGSGELIDLVGAHYSQTRTSIRR
jgi:hypothetical protein